MIRDAKGVTLSQYNYINEFLWENMQDCNWTKIALSATNVAHLNDAAQQTDPPRYLIVFGKQQ